MKTRLALLAACGLAAAILLPLSRAQTTSGVETGDAEPARAGSAEQPLPTDVIESAERRLVQLDVSFKSKKAGKHQELLELPLLSALDLELVVAGERVEIVHADRLCSAVPAASPASSAAPEPAAPAVDLDAAVQPRGVYVFYIEHSHLTMSGQVNALTMAEELIPRLVTGGVRGMVVSSGNEWIQSPLSQDPRPLLETIAAVQKNTRQWTSMAYAMQESSRIEEINRALTKGDVDIAKNLIRRYTQEEIALTNQRLRRMAALLGALTDLDPPRAVLYFADIVRKNAGEHYAQLMAVDPSTEQLGSSFSADFAFDRLTKQAGALGVRLYTVKAKGFDADSVGLNATTPISSRSGSSRPSVGGVSRMRHATDTMESLALETGGASFNGGTDRKSIDRVLDTIHDDLRCFYLLSFDPQKLPEDAPLPVRIRFNQDSQRYDELVSEFDLSSRGQIVIQSAGARREAILLGAHVAEDSAQESPARAVVIPLGWKDGSFEALAQLMVSNPQLPPTLTQEISWDLGMTHEFHDEVTNQVAGHVEVGEPGVAVVLEALWRFKPGVSRVVSVAHESRFGQVASAHREWDWPDPDGEAAIISPIAIVQPTHGVFLRKSPEGDQVRRLGSLGIGDGAALVDRPTYMISLVCRGKRVDQDLWIERRLIGAAPVEFGVQHWPHDDERCVQLRDLIPAGQMSWGDFSYEVAVYDSEKRTGDALARRDQEFAALEPGQTAEQLAQETTAKPKRVDPLAPPPVR